MTAGLSWCRLVNLVPLTVPTIIRSKLASSDALKPSQVCHFIMLLAFPPLRWTGMRGYRPMYGSNRHTSARRTMYLHVLFPQVQPPDCDMWSKGSDTTSTRQYMKSKVLHPSSLFVAGFFNFRRYEPAGGYMGRTTCPVLETRLIGGWQIFLPSQKWPSISPPSRQ